MKNTKIILSAIELWFFGLFIGLFKHIISAFIKINAPLSKRHIVITFKAYEHLLFIWYEKELKHLILLEAFKKA